MLWGTNNGVLVLDLVQDNHQVFVTVNVSESDGTQFNARLRGAFENNSLRLEADNFVGPPDVVLPETATLVAQLNVEYGYVEGTWSTSIGTTGRIVIFRFLAAQVPPPPFALFSKTIQFGPCRLDQQQIRTITELISQGVTTAPAGFNVMWNGRSAVKSGFDAVTADGNIPSVVNEMVVAVTDTVNNQVRRSVTIAFKKSDTNTIFVSGADNTWVEGKAAETVGFLSRHESRLWRFLKRWGSYLNAVIFLSLLAVLPSVPSMRGRAEVVIAAFLLLLTLQQFWRITPHAKLFVRQTKPGWYELNSGTLWISAITVILGAVIAYLLNRYLPTPPQVPR